MVASILRSAGYRVGLYTSPHLIRFNERITINSKCISDNDISAFIETYKEDIDRISSTFFETTTAMAFTYFANEKVDFAVVEVGLGGRLDSTNVVAPLVTAITPISLDHKDILGDSLLEIANEKAGIIKKNIPLIIGCQDKSINTFIHKIARQRNSPAIDIEEIKDISLSLDGTHFKTKWGSFVTPLLGYHQAFNAVTAITIIKSIDAKIDSLAIQKGLLETVWRGRLQKISSNLPLYYDVAHNAAGISAMIETIKSIYGMLPNIVFCLKGDKDIKLISDALKNNYGKLIITGSSAMELMEAKELSQSIAKYGLSSNIERYDEPNESFSALIDCIKLTNQPGVIMGSHYIAKAVFDKFGIFM
tara:strand:+ start:8339 stop:9424 length:1086 start_codon:yes stop_codon:yes gene_type:complete